MQFHRLANIPELFHLIHQSFQSITDRSGLQYRNLTNNLQIGLVWCLI